MRIQKISNINFSNRIVIDPSVIKNFGEYKGEDLKFANAAKAYMEGKDAFDFTNAKKDEVEKLQEAKLECPILKEVQKNIN